MKARETYYEAIERGAQQEGRLAVLRAIEAEAGQPDAVAAYLGLGRRALYRELRWLGMTEAMADERAAKVTKSVTEKSPTNQGERHRRRFTRRGEAA